MIPKLPVEMSRMLGCQAMLFAANNYQVTRLTAQDLTELGMGLFEASQAWLADAECCVIYSCLATSFFNSWTIVSCPVDIASSFF
jgi:hypothetical protein